MADLAPNLTPVEHDPFAGAALVAFAPVTGSGREVWLACAVDPELSIGYNEGLNLRLEGVLDVEALRSALQAIVRRHEALRMTISPDGESLCVLEYRPVGIPLEDAADEAAVHAAERQEMLQPLDLEHGPLVRFRILRRSAHLHHLLFVAHHAVVDGWSASVVMTELGALYSAAIEKRTLKLADPPRYTDYATIERSFLESAEGQKHVGYWLEHLDNPPPTLDLPSDRARTPQRTFAANRIDRRVAADRVARLRKASAAAGASLVSTMLATFGVLLHRLTQAEDMVIGLAAAGQSLHEQTGLVGHAVNLLPLRLKPKAGATFRSFIGETKGVVLDAFDHQGVTFGALLPQLHLVRDDSRPPLVSIIFNIDVRDDNISHSGLTVSYTTMERQAEVFEMFINVVDNGQDLVLECSYNRGLFDAATIDRRLTEYETLLDAVSTQLDAKIADLPLMTADERAALIAPPAIAEPKVACLHQWFEATAKTHAHRVAVTCEGASLTYAELDTRANRLAHLLHRHGAGPDVLVALYLERTLETVVAILGVLKAGAAYLPIDTASPADRAAFMLEDSGAPLLLTLDALRDKLPSGAAKVLTIDNVLDEAIGGDPATAPASSATPSSLAYCIYTSGSTGKPKGCLVTHANATRLFTSTEAWFGFGPDDVWTMFHSYAFDFSVWELWGALLYGGRVVVVPYWAAREPDKFLQLLADERVTVLNQTPSAFRQLIAAEAAVANPPALSLHTVVFGGEALEFQSLRPWFDRHGDRTPRLVNMYGITETTVHVTYRPVSKKDLDDGPTRSVIGEPIPDLSLLILDARGEPAPVGVTGEIHVGGAGVARGYLHRPELTDARFVPDPWRPGQRLYKSGDLARRLPDGEVEYLGRSDFQVKLRGFRVELGEIEAQLNRHPAVAESYVTVLERSEGDQRLVAYLVWKNPLDAVTQAELRRHLRLELPEYMVPQNFVDLPKFPLTGNGKLDRAALPNPFAAAAAAAPVRTPPRTPAEETVAALWREVLGVPQIGIEDRFIDLGGHSMLAVQAAARLQVAFGMRPPLRLVMMGTVAEVAGAARPAETAPAAAAKAEVPAPAKAPARAPPPARETGKTRPAPSEGTLSRIKKWLER